MKLNAANERLSALGSTSRLLILKLLGEHASGLSATELAEKLEVPAPTLSFHMSQLEKTRLVSSKRQGRSLIYTLNTNGLAELASFLTQTLPGGIMQETLPKQLVSITDDYLPLPCTACEEDLIPIIDHAIIAFAETHTSDEQPKVTKAVYVAHKGKCDRVLRSLWDNRETFTGWNDLDTYTNPMGFLRLLMTELNQRQRGDLYTDEAHKQLQSILIPLAQFVFREMTDGERAQYLQDRELDFLKF